MSGYNWSGSSAVVDILNDFASCCGIEQEFHIIKNPYGLDNLFNAVVNEGSRVRCDYNAIKDFLKWTDFLYRGGIFHYGFGYKKFFGQNFMDATQRFISSLVSFTHITHAWDIDFRNGVDRRFFLRRVVNKIFRILHLSFRIIPTDTLYVTNVNEEEFIDSAQRYIDDLFTPLASTNRASHVILDQAISQLNYKRELRFLRDARFIVVDRDPRDEYAELVKFNAWSFAEKRDVHTYVKFHKSLRRNYQKLNDDSEVLTLRFEDVVLHYEESLKRIIDFAGLDEADHAHKRKFFNPDVSVKNIGQWKNILSDYEVEVLTSELSEYL